MFTCRGRQGAAESNKEGSGSNGPFFIISFLIFFVLFKKKKIEMLQMVNCLTILNSRRYRTRLMSELTSCRRGAGDGVTGGTDNAC